MIDGFKVDRLADEVSLESLWTSTLVAHIVIYIESRQQVEESLERWRFAMERRRMKIRKRQDRLHVFE